MAKTPRRTRDTPRPPARTPEPHPSGARPPALPPAKATRTVVSTKKVRYDTDRAAGKVGGWHVTGVRRFD